jgi:methyl-accepting chemotaxis protein
MTPEQITLVQASFQRLEARLPDLATRFYVELFRRDPALRPLFTTDPAEQEARFARKLTELVQAIPDLDQLLAHTQALGARHVGYGVRAADYETVGAALLDALAVLLGADFDTETRQAWTVAYNLMAETMLDGAASARPAGR